MTKKFQREFQKNITDKIGLILYDYQVGGKHYLCKIECKGCEIHPNGAIFPNGKGTSISTSPSASIEDFILENKNSLRRRVS